MRRTLPVSQNFLAIEREFSSYDTSRIVILPAPYEHSVSYGGGTALGPAALLRASHFVEFWDEEFKSQLCFERGIAVLPPLRFGSKTDAAALALIKEAVARILDDGKFCVTLGGEHSISSAPIRAYYERHPGMSVLQFDAHSDLRAEYQGNPYSHASVMARVCDFFPPKRIVQAGIRAQCVEEYDFIRSSGINTFFARDIRSGEHGKNWAGKIVDALGDEVYITFDVDFFDPSIMPATGTPEPGGFYWDETIDLLKMIGSKKNIIGCDIVELAPLRGMPFPTFLAATLLYKLLNAAFQGRK